MKLEDFAGYRKALNDTVLNEHNNAESKKGACLQSIAHSLIDVSELLWKIDQKLKR